MSKKEYKVALDNPAKSLNRYSKNPGRSASKSRKSGHNEGGHKRGGHKAGKVVGYILLSIQVAASVLMMGMLILLDMLPMKYLAAIGAVLLLLLLPTLMTQIKAKKKAASIGGKIFSVLMSLILLTGSFYTYKANSAVGEISGGEYKIDNIVVAVLKEDAAENIKDAAGYIFGVQYAMGGDDIRDGVATINEELGSEIETMEYSSLNEQAAALQSGEVEAIIYNEGYTGILEETIEGYSESIKIIYKHSIKTLLDNKASDVDVTDSTFSVFISGIDVYGPIETNSRSDVNIIATVNTKSRQILLVTTPRDYYVEIPGISGGMRDKLTHAGIYGVDASIATLSQLYDMDIDFYARVNFTSLIEIVDVLGGVEVYSEYAFQTSPDTNYGMGTSLNVQEGYNTFNGKEALMFSRERHNIPGGDNQRGKNQQAVITAIIKKMISPSMLVNANSLINSVSGNVETNMSQDQIQELVKMQLSEGGSWNIYSVAAEGTGSMEVCYSGGSTPLSVIWPDEASVSNIAQLVDQVEQGEVLEGSEQAQ